MGHNESAMNFAPFRTLLLRNFVERRKGEVRRIPLPRRWVNRAISQRIMLKRHACLDTISTRAMGPALRSLRVAGNRSHY
jgi:hypothetical protein